MRALVVYGDAEIRSQVLNALALNSGIHVVADCTYNEYALDKIDRLRPDVVFAITGMVGLPDLAALFSRSYAKRPYLVVVSDCERYAIESFAINAIDYLLTPLDHSRFRITMDRLRRYIDMEQYAERRLDLDTLVQRLREYPGKAPTAHNDDRVSINFGGRFRFLFMKSIRYIEADADYSDIHMITGEVLHSTSRISEIANKLPTNCFLRVRRSTVVNIQYVSEVRARKDNYEIVMDNGAVFRPGTTYKFKVRAELMKGMARFKGISASSLES